MTIKSVETHWEAGKGGGHVLVCGCGEKEFRVRRFEQGTSVAQFFLVCAHCDETVEIRETTVWP